MKQPRSYGAKRGFSRASSLMQTSIRKATETRGFAQARVLTHWEEIVGKETAAIAHPVDVSYAKGGLGATLTVLTSGAQAPMLEMQKEQIRDRVNACYGYNAIARIRFTQTARTGFAEGQMAFDHGPTKRKLPTERTREAAENVAAAVESDALRTALAALGANVMTKRPSDT